MKTRNLVALLVAAGMLEIQSLHAVSLTNYSQIYDTPSTWDYAPYWVTEPDSSTEAFYWGSDDPNTGPEGDIIKLMTRTTGGTWSSAQVILQPDVGDGTYNTWEGGNVCDPAVVKGSFLYNSHYYAYAMYYSAGPGAAGTVNAGVTAIGVAFSDDKTTWVKYDQNPIITSQYGSGYGAGQASIYSNNGYSTLSMVHTDGSTSYVTSYLRTTTDGIHWSSPSAISDTNLGSSFHSPTGHLPSADIAFDYNTSKWYLAYNVGTSDVKLFISDSIDILTCTWTDIGGIPSSGVPDDVKFDVCIKKTAWGNITPELPTVTIAYGSRSGSMLTARVMAASNY